MGPKHPNLDNCCECRASIGVLSLSQSLVTSPQIILSECLLCPKRSIGQENGVNVLDYNIIKDGVRLASVAR